MVAFGRALILCLCGVLPALLAGCGSTPIHEPLAMMLDTKQGYSRRLEAARQAQALGSDPRHIRALNSLLYDRGHPDMLRIYAVDQLLQIDAVDFRKNLPRRIILVSHWEVVNHILERGLAENWPELDLVLVRSYARSGPWPDDKRPERAMLEKRHPGQDVAQVVFQIFSQQTPGAQTLEQVSAWELLARIAAPEQLARYLQQAPAASPLVIDLQASAAQLGVLPRNREGILWLSYLRDPQRQEFWQQAAKLVSELQPEQRQGLELRHLAALLLLEPAQRQASRQQLLEQVAGQLAAAQHYLKSPTFDGAAPDTPQGLREAADRLAWADLAAITVLLRAVRDPQVRASLFSQADADEHDTSTEHGGLLAQRQGRFVAQSYPPTFRANDRKFLPDAEMIEHMYTALAHYHFHAQQEHNRDYAGPGLGDLKMADRLHPSALVFTFIDRDSLNVDYYQAGQLVVDLGTIQR